MAYNDDKPQGGSQTDKDAALLHEAKELFQDAVQADDSNYHEACEDIAFRAGLQWDDTLKTERERTGRPCLTINRMPQFIRQITGDMRQSRPSIKVRPNDDDSDPAVAEIYNGLIRSILDQSQASMVMMQAADCQVTGGIGHWRVTAEYNADDSFDQDIYVRPIPNPHAVLWDPDARQLTREDAEYCFVQQWMSERKFKRLYPKATECSSFSGRGNPVQSDAWWYRGDQVLVCEWWRKMPYKRKLAVLQGGAVVDVTDIKSDMLAILAVEKVIERDATKVQQVILSGSSVLQQPRDWPGKYIPIVPVVGEEVSMGTTTMRHGAIRYAKDAQRMYNYFRSTQMEAVQGQTKAPWLLTPDMVKGHQGMWDAANYRNFAYLYYNIDPKNPALSPQRIQPAVSSSGMSNEIALAAEDMKSTTGIYDAGLGKQGNETSGKAILARQVESDTGTYVYLDNLGHAVRYTGRILVDLIPQYYNKRRVVRVLGEDEKEAQWARVNQEGAPDLTVGKYDVTVTTGPGYSTRRQEAADSMMSFAAAVPGAGAVMGDLLAKAMDWPEADKIADRLQKILPPALQETPPPAAPPSPADEMTFQKMQGELASQSLDNEQKALNNAEMKARLGVLLGMNAPAPEPEPAMMGWGYDDGNAAG